MLYSDLDPTVPDNIILADALYNKHIHPDSQVIMVTRDANLRVKADIVGLEVQDYRADKVDTTEIHTGIKLYESTSRVQEEILKGGCSNYFNLTPNEYCIIRNETNDKVICARYSPIKDKILPLTTPAAQGLKPFNMEQQMALDALADPNISLVTLIGQAGSGKTLLSIAMGLEMVKKRAYSKMLVSRPVIPMGKDLGYLPGNIDEKMMPWMQPIFDNLEFLTGSMSAYTSLQTEGLLQVEALTYIRGRSIPKQYFILDEAQNLTAHEAKTIITRAGEGTKIIMTGDPNQIDNPYVDAYSNGLSYVAQKFTKSEISAHITLKRGERSPLASEAAERL